MRSSRESGTEPPLHLIERPNAAADTEKKLESCGKRRDKAVHEFSEEVSRYQA
jgi:hypothetical protein